MTITSLGEESRLRSHRSNCKNKVKLTVEEAAQNLWNRPKKHGFDIYICSNCDHLHFGHNHTEKTQIREALKERHARGKAIKILGNACHHLKRHGGNKAARNVINGLIKQLTPLPKQRTI